MNYLTIGDNNLQKIPFLKKIYFIYIFLIWIGSATRYIESDILIFGTFIVSFFLFLKSKKKFSKKIAYLIIVYLFVNVLSILFNGNEFNLVAFVGYNLRILTAYFSISYLGKDFFRMYRNGVLIMAIISIPFYLIQLFLGANFFINNFGFLNLSSELRQSVNYWNCLFYTTHSTFTNFGIRNDGFCIEPGHFGGVLVLAIIFELIENHFKLNKRLGIMVVVGLTTFSTTYYISLIFIVIIFLLNNKMMRKHYFMSLLIFVPLIFAIATSNIIINKIETTSVANTRLFRKSYQKLEEGSILNRFGAFKIGMKNFINYPLGYGYNTAGLLKNFYGKVITGPNSLVTIILHWGIVGLFFLPFFLYKFWQYYFPYMSRINYIILVILILILLFSVSIQSRSYLLFFMLIIGLEANKKYIRVSD